LSAVLLDTHVWSWSLKDDSRLTPKAAAAITGADAVWLSVISFFEIGQKVRLGKWPEMASLVDELPTILSRQGGLAADLDGSISLLAATMLWSHRDPFDRLIAATALKRGLALVSADPVFDEVVSRIW
jgi:PIN domain nuclease of toxin-antitoxin system